MAAIAGELGVRTARGVIVGTLVGARDAGVASEGFVSNTSGSVLRVVITVGRVVMTVRDACVTADLVDLRQSGSVGLDRPEAMDSESVSGSCSGGLGVSSWAEVGEGAEVGEEAASLGLDLVLVTGTGVGRLHVTAPQ